MCPMPFYYYALYSLKLQLDITFTHMVRFKHMTRHFNCFNLKICLITFSRRSDGKKHRWFKTLIQASCALSVFRILICENPSLCQGQNIGSKMGCQHSHCCSGFFISRLRYCHLFGRFCKRCPFAWMIQIFNGLGICLSIDLRVY